MTAAKNQLVDLMEVVVATGDDLTADEAALKTIEHREAQDEARYAELIQALGNCAADGNESMGVKKITQGVRERLERNGWRVDADGTMVRWDHAVVRQRRRRHKGLMRFAHPDLSIQQRAFCLGASVSWLTVAALYGLSLVFGG